MMQINNIANTQFDFLETFKVTPDDNISGVTYTEYGLLRPKQAFLISLNKNIEHYYGQNCCNIKTNEKLAQHMNKHYKNFKSLFES
ncbi:hypothetical protein QIA41_04820 (plasmid) [Borreliella sinica]|uniref:hypothetical protein n=1 Tax=Borreliella sinica TaxID=87162 RepID=UPI002A24A197|nr:hypothetical protein [Borreliella sinica]WPM06419.1 hypothetical protein QIA41_04820 [Borreliella sinica]